VLHTVGNKNRCTLGTLAAHIATATHVSNHVQCAAKLCSLFLQCSLPHSDLSGCPFFLVIFLPNAGPPKGSVALNQECSASWCWSKRSGMQVCHPAKTPTICMKHERDKHVPVNVPNFEYPYTSQVRMFSCPLEYTSHPAHRVRACMASEWWCRCHATTQKAKELQCLSLQLNANFHKDSDRPHVGRVIVPKSFQTCGSWY